ncbi:hypothetical protein V6N13_083759 [Hibiscus sabdariffa]
MATDGDFVSKTTLFLVGFIAVITFPAEADVRKYQFDGNGGTKMLKRLSSKELTWDCHQICRMHTLSMGNPDHFFHVPRNVSRNLKKLLSENMFSHAMLIVQS